MGDFFAQVGISGLQSLAFIVAIVAGVFAGKALSKGKVKKEA